MTSSRAAETASETLSEDRKSVKTDWLYEARSSSLRSVRTFDVAALLYHTLCVACACENVNE